MSPQLSLNEPVDRGYRLANAQFRGVALQLQKVCDISSNLDRCDRLGEFFELDRRDTFGLFDVPNGEERSQNVEVLLKPNALLEKVPARVAARHVAVVIPQSLRVKRLWGELA